jgi:hypothetical protein
LRQDPENQVELVDGERGQLTVLVNGREVASKDDTPPSVDEVKAAVEKAAPATAR